MLSDSGLDVRLTHLTGQMEKLYQAAEHMFQRG